MNVFARMRPALPVLILGVGLSFAAVLRLQLRELQARALRAEIAMEAQSRLELLRSSWLRSLEALHACVAYLEVEPELSRAAFRSLAGGAIERLPELQAVEWIPRVPAAQRARYEAAAEADGYLGYRFNELGPDGRLRSAGERAEYFPVYYAEPPDGNLPALGLDLGAHPLRRSAIERARQSGLPAASAPVRLAQETRAGELGVLVFAPVQRSGELRGFGLVVLRIRDFVSPSFTSLTAAGLHVTIHDTAQPELSLFEAGDPPGAGALQHSASLDLAGRAWQLSFAAGPEFARKHASLEPELYPLAVLALTLLIAAYVAHGLRRTREIERRVDERTQALRMAEAKYRTLFENALLGIFQTTPQGQYLDANPALAHIYGYASPAELMAAVRDIGKQLYVDPSLRERFAAELREHGRVSDFVAEVRRKDGSTTWISETALAVRGPSGGVAYYEGSVQDVNARVLAEEAQKRSFEWLEDNVRERTSELHAEVEIRKRAQEEAAQARDAQTQFLANLSHEIRTPLNAIIGYSQLLQRYDNQDALHREALAAIVQGGQHLLSLVDEVIDLSKIESGHLQLVAADFNLGALVAGLSALFRNKCERKGLQLRIEGLGAAPRWVRGDEGKLRQVLINLLGNAVKFTERGEVRLRVVPQNETAFRFEVIDTGIGIEPGEQARVFGEFYQAEPSRAAEGAGLGLAISRRLVALMGGALELRSTSGWGSNFHFALEFERPLAVVASQAEMSHPRMRLAPGTRCKVLVVDDLEVNRNVLCHMLAAIGCEADSVASGAEALERVAREPPQLVFLDVLMPGMNGIQTAQALRRTAHGAELKLVAFSASAFEKQRTLYLASSFDAFMSKPFRIERIGDCLVQLLGVQFVADAAPDPEARSDFTGVRLPALLLDQLREAAESYQVTRLRQAFEQLERGGADQAALAARLRASAALYDMPSVLAVLSHMEVTPHE